MQRGTYSIAYYFFILVGQLIPWFECRGERIDSAIKIESTSATVRAGAARNYHH